LLNVLIYIIGVDPPNDRPLNHRERSRRQVVVEEPHIDPDGLF
jgi:hypothetical protein